MKVNIVFYSAYGHIYQMAEAMAEGTREVKGADVKLFQVTETLSNELLARIGALETKKKFTHIPIATLDNLVEADAIIFGTPTRYGMMCAQMKSFIDGTGSLWIKGLLIGKVASVFTSTATQHGGQESTILNFHTVLLHHGMVIVGLPYPDPKLGVISEISGGSPYGASTIAGGDGSRFPSGNELAIARMQGKHVAEIANRLSKSK